MNVYRLKMNDDYCDYIQLFVHEKKFTQEEFDQIVLRFLVPKAEELGFGVMSAVTEYLVKEYGFIFIDPYENEVYPTFELASRYSGLGVDILKNKYSKYLIHMT